MSRFIFKIIAVAALAAGSAVALKDGVRVSETFGGPHGTEYSDLDAASPGQTVQSITIRAGERVNAVGIDITDPWGAKSVMYHGGDGGDKNTLTLGSGEYITGIEAHWGEKDSHTRIKYISFTTNNGNSVSGGIPTKNVDDMGQSSASEGYQLGGFVGRSGKELDSVGAVWTSIKPLESPLD